jgi:hypothetical protein
VVINFGNHMALNLIPDFRRVRLRTNPWCINAPYTRRVASYPKNPVRVCPREKIPPPAAPRLSAPFGKGGGEGVVERGIYRAQRSHEIESYSDRLLRSYRAFLIVTVIVPCPNGF